MNHYDYPFNRPGYWNGCVPPNENGTVIVRIANARNGEDANGEEDVSSLRNSPSESSLFFYHTDYARISKPYHDLPLRLQSFLILTELGKTPNEMEEIFCVSPSSIKAYRHRLKELQRHDMA